MTGAVISNSGRGSNLFSFSPANLQMRGLFKFANRVLVRKLDETNCLLARSCFAFLSIKAHLRRKSMHHYRAIDFA
jgi:hypothetical protein